MGKHVNRKKYVKQEYLPSKLVKRLQECVINNDTHKQYNTKNNLLQCVVIIYYHQVKQGAGIRNYVPLGSDYWKTVYGHEYKRVLNPLLDDQIIESYDYGFRKGEVGIRYRINPDLLDDQNTTIMYIEKGRVLTGEERMLFGKKEFTTDGIPDTNYRISINHKKASKWVDDNAVLICYKFLMTDYIKNLPESLVIEYRELYEKYGNWTYRKKYRSVKSAKEHANKYNKELVYFNKNFYIADTKVFLKQRIESLRNHYKHQVNQIYTQPIIEKRNPKTLRMYSELTNFPSKVLQFININNCTVVQLDLKTSQFLLFANLLNVYTTRGEQFLLSNFKQDQNQTYIKKLVRILKKFQSQLPKAGVDIKNSTSGENSNSDVTRFVRDVFFEDFYEVIQHELGLQHRLFAKNVMFKLLFKKSNRTDELLLRLSQRYEVVMAIIAEFKARDNENQDDELENLDFEHGSNFSVFLQCIEAEIYIDNILKKLRDEGVPCFTRHDSIVVARGYEKLAKEVAEAVFRDFGFKYSDKEEDKFWDVATEDELETSNYMQGLIDENDLEPDFWFDDSDDNPEDNESENTNDMDEHQQETIKRLTEIGTKESYFGIIDAVFLEEITLLPFLFPEQENVLYDEVNNQNYGMPCFQPETDELIRQIIHRFS